MDRLQDEVTELSPILRLSPGSYDLRNGHGLQEHVECAPYSQPLHGQEEADSLESETHCGGEKEDEVVAEEELLGEIREHQKRQDCLIKKLLQLKNKKTSGEDGGWIETTSPELRHTEVVHDDQTCGEGRSRHRSKHNENKAQEGLKQPKKKQTVRQKSPQTKESSKPKREKRTGGARGAESSPPLRKISETSLPTSPDRDGGLHSLTYPQQRFKQTAQRSPASEKQKRKKRKRSAGGGGSKQKTVGGEVKKSKKGRKNEHRQEQDRSTLQEQYDHQNEEMGVTDGLHDEAKLQQQQQQQRQLILETKPERQTLQGNVCNDLHCSTELLQQQEEQQQLKHHEQLDSTAVHFSNEHWTTTDVEDSQDISALKSFTFSQEKIQDSRRHETPEKLDLERSATDFAQYGGGCSVQEFSYRQTNFKRNHIDGVPDQQQINQRQYHQEQQFPQYHEQSHQYRQKHHQHFAENYQNHKKHHLYNQEQQHGTHEEQHRHNQKQHYHQESNQQVNKEQLLKNHQAQYQHSPKHIAPHLDLHQSSRQQQQQKQKLQQQQQHLPQGEDSPGPRETPRSASVTERRTRLRKLCTTPECQHQQQTGFSPGPARKTLPVHGRNTPVCARSEGIALPHGLGQTGNIHKKAHLRPRENGDIQAKTHQQPLRKLPQQHGRPTIAGTGKDKPWHRCKHRERQCEQHGSATSCWSSQSLEPKRSRSQPDTRGRVLSLGCRSVLSESSVVDNEALVRFKKKHLVEWKLGPPCPITPKTWDLTTDRQKAIGGLTPRPHLPIRHASPGRSFLGRRSFSRGVSARPAHWSHTRNSFRSPPGGLRPGQLWKTRNSPAPPPFTNITNDGPGVVSLLKHEDFVRKWYPQSTTSPIGKGPRLSTDPSSRPVSVSGGRRRTWRPNSPQSKDQTPPRNPARGRKQGLNVDSKDTPKLVQSRSPSSTRTKQPRKSQTLKGKALSASPAVAGPTSSRPPLQRGRRTKSSDLPETADSCRSVPRGTEIASCPSAKRCSARKAKLLHAKPGTSPLGSKHRSAPVGSVGSNTIRPDQRTKACNGSAEFSDKPGLATSFAESLRRSGRFCRVGVECCWEVSEKRTFTTDLLRQPHFTLGDAMLDALGLGRSARGGEATSVFKNGSSSPFPDLGQAAAIFDKLGSKIDEFRRAPALPACPSFGSSPVNKDGVASPAYKGLLCGGKDQTISVSPREAHALPLLGLRAGLWMKPGKSHDPSHVTKAPQDKAKDSAQHDEEQAADDSSSIASSLTVSGENYSPLGSRRAQRGSASKKPGRFASSQRGCPVMGSAESWIKRREASLPGPSPSANAAVTSHLCGGSSLRTVGPIETDFSHTGEKTRGENEAGFGGPEPGVSERPCLVRRGSIVLNSSPALKHDHHQHLPQEQQNHRHNHMVPESNSDQSAGDRKLSSANSVSTKRWRDVFDRWYVWVALFCLLFALIWFSFTYLLVLTAL